MTATKELRALLDERGVEWTDGGNALLLCTVWHGQDGKQWRMTENMSGTLTELKSWHVTPAQAVEATLWRGECRMLRISEACYDDIECSECGACLWGFQIDMEGEGVKSRPKYCPNCGRKVVTE